MSGFKDVVGHTEIIEYMKNAVKQDKVSHAYILNGPKGSGKKLLAKLFAQELQCENNGDEPCNKCHSCRQAMSGNHPDIIRVTHEKPNSISVDEIRVQINEDIQVKPYIRVEVPGFAQEHVADTTGAGDTFCGSVLNYVLEHGIEDLSEENLKEMLTFANAAASLITTKKGAIRSMPEKEEIEAMI